MSGTPTPRNSPESIGGTLLSETDGLLPDEGVVELMRRILILILALWVMSSVALAQFGGREGDAVLYVFNAKGAPDLQVVPFDAVNTVSGFEVKRYSDEPWVPFGPDYESEFFVTLHSEPGDSFRIIEQREDLVIQHSVLMGPMKILIAEGLDRLLIPDKAPVDLTTGLYAPFPEGVDFGPELPLFQAHAFIWSPSPLFPLFDPVEPDYTSPIVPPGLTGSEYVLTLGQFLGILPWQSLRRIHPGVGWADGIDMKMIEEDTELGSTARVLRLRSGRRTPPFRIGANTHLVVLSGSVQIAPMNASPVSLGKFDYAFVPNGFAITLLNPRKFDFAGTEASPSAQPETSTRKGPVRGGPVTRNAGNGGSSPFR